MRGQKILEGKEKYNVAIRQFGGNWIEIEGQDKDYYTVTVSIETFYLNR